MDYENRGDNGKYIVLKSDGRNKSYDRTGNGKKTHIYEHHAIAQEMIGRDLREDEEVHHLDKNPINNSPDNLLVLTNTQHVKLHSWLDKNVIIPKPKYALRTLKGCIRCKNCDKPIDPESVYCSVYCNNEYIKKKSEESTPIDKLQELVNTYPLTTVGKMIGLSDNGVRARCKSLGVVINKK